MYCILVTGIPAAGKSTLAGRLADALALPLLQKDAIKEILFDDLGFRSREEKVKLGVASMDIMYHMAGRLMALGQPFILENNFEDVSRPGLLALLERYGYTALTVSLTGDYRRIYERFLQRNADPLATGAMSSTDAIRMAGRRSGKPHRLMNSLWRASPSAVWTALRRMVRGLSWIRRPLPVWTLTR